MAKKTTIFETPFDTYTSFAIIGEGGAGRVYAVKNVTGEDFALKCLAPGRITSERLRRFKNEIWFCQSCNHSNIVKVIDAGATLIDGVKCPFYVMPRYSGTLRTQMGSIKPESIIVFFSQILDGVEAAHMSKVWHRDLKPENILYDQHSNRLVVADFGIAHFEEEDIFTAVETKATDRLANFHYSAPEQRVRNSKVDNRADIFALGLILNEMFTGEVLQGAGHKRIADVAPDYSYLDGIVEMMSQQNPVNRPESIEKIKIELIGRKNAFIALQKYDDAKKQVVPISEVPEFIPVKIAGLDYDAGTLTLKLSRNVPPGWAQEFNNPRGGHSALVGYGPERFTIRGNTATIGVRGDESFIQQIVNHAKNYAEAANRNYVLQMQEQASREEKQRRAALEKQITEAEKKKNILANIKL